MSDENVIIVFDSMMPAVNRDTLSEQLSRFSRLTRSYDVCYLHRYMDECQKCNLIASNDEDDSGYQMYNCYTPKGLDALIYTRSGRNKFLDDDLKQCKVKAVCFSPNLFQYDIHNHSHSTRDYDKTVTCAPLQKTTTTRYCWYSDISNVIRCNNLHHHISIRAVVPWPNRIDVS